MLAPSARFNHCMDRRKKGMTWAALRKQKPSIGHNLALKLVSRELVRAKSRDDVTVAMGDIVAL